MRLRSWLACVVLSSVLAPGCAEHRQSPPFTEADRAACAHTARLIADLRADTLTFGDFYVGVRAIHQLVASEPDGLVRSGTERLMKAVHGNDRGEMADRIKSLAVYCDLLQGVNTTTGDIPSFHIPTETEEQREARRASIREAYLKGHGPQSEPRRTDSSDGAARR